MPWCGGNTARQYQTFDLGETDEKAYVAPVPARGFEDTLRDVCTDKGIDEEPVPVEYRSWSGILIAPAGRKRAKLTKSKASWRGDHATAGWCSRR